MTSVLVFVNLSHSSDSFYAFPYSTMNVLFMWRDNRAKNPITSKYHLVLFLVLHNYIKKPPLSLSRRHSFKPVSIVWSLYSVVILHLHSKESPLLLLNPKNIFWEYFDRGEFPNYCKQYPESHNYCVSVILRRVSFPSKYSIVFFVSTWRVYCWFYLPSENCT